MNTAGTIVGCHPRAARGGRDRLGRLQPLASPAPGCDVTPPSPFPSLLLPSPLSSFLFGLSFPPLTDWLPAAPAAAVLLHPLPQGPALGRTGIQPAPGRLRRLVQRPAAPVQESQRAHGRGRLRGRFGCGRAAGRSRPRPGRCVGTRAPNTTATATRSRSWA